MATFQILEENENVPKRYKNWNTKTILQCLFAILTIASFIITWSVFGSKYNEQSELLINFTTMLSDRIDHIETYQIPRLDQKIENGAKNDFHSKVASARSCKELQDHGYRKDGYYFVDPDGRYQGFNSLEVYCENMDDQSKTIRMIIKPQNTTQKFFTNASEPQLFRPGYQASMKQLNTLVKNSGNCYQKIDFQCHKMPLHLPNNQRVAAWVDYDHTEWTFFHGSDWNDSKCDIIPIWTRKIKCNCDENNDEDEDHGTITAQWLLPIQSFVYDATKNFNFSKDGAMQVNIGPLICEEEFKLDVQGPLAKLAQPEIEKIFWNPWDRFELKFYIYNLINATVQDQRCKKILEILDISDANQNKTFLELTLCRRNLTLTQNINGKMTPITVDFTNHGSGRSLVTADRKQVKVTSPTLNYPELSIHRMDVIETYFEKSFANYTLENSASPKKSKITVWPSFRDETFLEITDFKLENVKKWW